ncbi:glycosyltransferase [Georgenia sp. AZ-5]|uniref:glycosyltransferase n=1 Tax=Georgenia sp. AZ-5 TaxID=3367526 RepID=UPI00375471AF
MTPTDTAPPGGFPIPVGAIDVLHDAAYPAPNSAGRLSLLVTVNGRPIGSVLLEGLGEEPGHEELRDVCLRQLAGHVRQLVGAGDTPGPAADGTTDELLRALDRARPRRIFSSATPVTVVVCTLGRDPRLPETVRSLLAQTHRHLELCIVDNDPASGGTQALLAGIQDPRLRTISEPRRGLSVARNSGLAAASHSIVAFTDDDAVPDADWLAAIVAVFDADTEGNVTGVTGLVRAAELSSPEQLWFEAYGGFDKGYEPRIWSWRTRTASVSHLGTPAPRGPFFPYTTGKVGSGNNMAFRTRRLVELGGFDVALGAGSIAQGGEDLDIFTEVLLAGDVIVYTPDALVWHYHRRTYAELRTQMIGNGVGMGAVITKQLLRGPAHAARLAKNAPVALLHLLDPRSARNEGRGPDYPRDLVLTELRGLLAGPYHLVRSRYAARRRGLRYAR